MQSFHVKVLILTLVLLGGGLFSYSLVKNGFFPVARVNGQIVIYRTLTQNIDVSRRLYTAGLAGSNDELDQLFSRGSQKDLLKGALSNVITSIVIKTSVSPEILAQANQEIESGFSQGDTANLAKSVSTIYGWDVNKFKKRILQPQALLKVLAKDKKDEFKNWLMQAKTQARINIWFLPFKWQNGELLDK